MKIIIPEKRSAECGIHMPDSPNLFREATELVELGRLDEALVIFRTLLKTDSNNTVLWNNIGIIQFRQGKYRDTVNAFEQASDTDPQNTNAWFNKSLALVHLGEDIEALRALDKAIMLNPRDKEAQSQRALIVRNMAQVSDTGRTDSHLAQSQLRV
jgi:tetratricopeptide (TPR) repeat protein